jgi:hypothetical protein
MSIFFSMLRWLVSRLSAALVVVAVVGRIWRAWRGHAQAGTSRRESERALLPSLYDVHPAASTAPRRAIGLRPVPLDRIVGTLRHPSQNTADFKPLPRLRGQNWRARWQRINRAMERLEVLPPVDLVQAGDEYWVADGHNRVAVARAADAVEIDADVTQLVLPGVATSGQTTLDASSLIGAQEVRQAAGGRRSRTVEQWSAVDEVTRKDLARMDDERP